MNLFDDDDDDDDETDSDEEYSEDMREFDYRHIPYSPPSLATEEKRLVEEDLDLLKRKGNYSYEYMDSFERFEEREIPSIKAFNSILSGGGITEKEHVHAKKVFEHLI